MMNRGPSCLLAVTLAKLSGSEDQKCTLLELHEMWDRERERPRGGQELTLCPPCRGAARWFLIIYVQLMGWAGLSSCVCMGLFLSFSPPGRPNKYTRITTIWPVDCDGQFIDCTHTQKPHQSPRENMAHVTESAAEVVMAPLTERENKISKSRDQPETFSHQKVKELKWMHRKVIFPIN